MDIGRRWPAQDEARAVDAETVFAEWLAACGGKHCADTAELRAWARAERPAFHAAFAGFTGQQGRDTRFLDALAGFLLTARLRPDDVLLWTGDPGHPALAAARATGADVLTDAATAPQGARRLEEIPQYP